MSDNNSYTPPRIWKPDEKSGGRFSGINRPEAGARYEEELPLGKHPFQLYSLATPNGVKVTVLFEELLARNHTEAEYDAWPINILEGEQFSTGFTGVNPNSKIPALMDYSEAGQPVRIFESGAIMLYLAEKFDEFLPKDTPSRTETLSWLFWQIGAAPFLGGGFGHFYTYAPEPMKYPIDRFTMEVKRQLDVLDRRLAQTHYLAGDEYTIADIANWSWYGALALGRLYEGSDEFLQVDSYRHLQRWAREIDQRPAVKRGRMVNRFWGEPEEQLHERHNASDFEHHTSDKQKGTNDPGEYV
jgi:GST-like protein